MMQGERERLDEAGPLLYHINLVELLACCTEGKNVYTEIKCHSLLPLDDIVRVVTHPDCISEVRDTGNNVSPVRVSASYLRGSVSDWMFVQRFRELSKVTLPHGCYRDTFLSLRKQAFALFTVSDLELIVNFFSLGEECLCKLFESLLCWHGGRNEGDIHQQSHLDSVWGLFSRHGSGERIK